MMRVVGFEVQNHVVCRGRFQIGWLVRAHTITFGGKRHFDLKILVETSFMPGYLNVHDLQGLRGVMHSHAWSLGYPGLFIQLLALDSKPSHCWLALS